MPGRKKVSQEEPEYDCELCERENAADDMVECTQCNLWYHFDCVGVHHVTEEQIWLCPICIERQQQSLVRKNQPIAENIGELEQCETLIQQIPPRSSLSTTAPGFGFSEEMMQMIQRNIVVVGDRMISRQAYTRETTSTTRLLGQQNLSMVGQVRTRMVQNQRNVPVVESPSTTLVITSGNQDLATEPQQGYQGAIPKSAEPALSRKEVPPLIEDDISGSIRSDKTNTTIRKNRIELERLKEQKRIEDEVYEQEEIEREQDRVRDREREVRDREQQRIRRQAKLAREKEYLDKMYDLRQNDVDSVSRVGSVMSGSARNWLRKLQNDRDLEYISKKYNCGKGDEAASRSGYVSENSNSVNEWLKGCAAAKNPSVIDYDEFHRRIDALKFNTTSPMKNKAIQPQEVKKFQTFANAQQLPKSKIVMSDKASQTSEEFETEEKPYKPKKVKKGDDPPSEPSNSSSSNGSSSSKKKPSIKREVRLPTWEQDVEGNDEVRILSRNEIASRQVVQKKLDPFWGDPKTWPHFISQLKTTTKMCGFTDDENLNRLNECLKGKARDKVEHQLDVSGSFEIVMWTLRLIFGRPELVVDELITKVQKLERPKSDNLESLVDFAMTVNGIVSMIKKAELPNHLTNPILLKELVEKLPTQEKKEWAKHIGSKSDVNLVNLGDWLRKLAEEVVIVTKPTFTKPTKDNKSHKHWKISSENYHKKSEQTYSHQDVKSPVKEKNSKNEPPSMGQISRRNCSVCKKMCLGIANCDEFKSNDVGKRWSIVKNLKLCKICLKRHGGYCYFNKACGKNGCKISHHELLHDDNYKKPQKTETKEVNAVHVNINSKVLLRIVPVLIYGGNEVFSTYAFMDDGSTTTLIEKRIVDQLKIRGKPTDLCLLWSGKIHRTEKNSQEVVVSVSSVDKGSIKYKLRGVKTVADLGIQAQSIDKEEMCKKYPHLRGIPFIGYENGVPGILIGSNNAKVSAQLNIIEGRDGEPLSFETRIGWSIYGSTGKPADEVSKLFNVKECKCECDDNMHQALKDHFSIENFGVQVPNNLVRDSKENERALNQLKVLTKRSGDRFETGLLWKDDSCKLPESYNMAFKRLQHFEQRKPKEVSKITETINDYVKKGYARKLSQQELKQNHQRVWYLPIFTVFHPKKPEKIRVVFDARAKAGGTSLNEMLLKGPDQMTSLVDILRRFREKKIAICGDIKEMFHQVKVREEDQHCQRFLWRDGDESKNPDIYVMNVMTFGATCSPSAAQYVKNQNAEQFSNEYPEAAKAIINSHYVDDMMANADSEEAGIQLVNDIKKVHARGGFEIRNFLSNSKTVMEAIGSTVGEKSKKVIQEGEMNIQRVLGMWWDTEKDCFTYSLQFATINGKNSEKMPTKREMLRILMSVFDPLGLISHFLVHLKLLVQEIWRSNKKWDEEITDPNLIDLWFRWLKIFLKVENVQIPRLYSPKLSPNTSTSVELHVFVDASVEAFGAVCYLRIEDHEGVDCALVGSKSRVAPLKYLSVPRSELQAAVLGTRLSTSIIAGQDIEITKRVLWSDSATVLLWLRSDNRNYHQFVAHRVGEILENTNIDEWRWVPSKLNPADQLTKWKGEPTFDFTNEWYQGPVFLRLPPENWPIYDGEEKADATAELKMAHSEFDIPRIIDPERFSSWNKIVRALAQAIRFIKVVRAKVLKQPIKTRMDKEELELARNAIIRQAQYEVYTEEMVTLKFNVGLPANHRKDLQKGSSLYKLNPYLDEEEIIRMRGRIDLAPVPDQMKRPIILPRNNKITRLLVKCYHDSYHCRSHATVINEIRQKFRIPQIRMVLKSVITKDCQPCKNRRTKPEVPMMADLPSSRLEVGFRAFTSTGLDYFGPIMVVDGKRNLKRWGVLFTCMTVRAVHVEIAHSLDTESCIMCIGNFIYLRGKPNEIFSDNGTNFVGTSNELSEAIKNIDEEAMKTHFEVEPYYTKWTFIPAKAKHMGGIWETLVKAIKRGLEEAIPTFRKPTDEMLRNLLMESMNIVNSRPLTYIPMDDENDEILTPNHFIHGTSNATKPPINVDMDGPNLKSKWQEVQRLTQIFWQRFIKEYLPEITRRTKWYVQVRPLEIGDIVLDVSEKNARNTYPKGRVIETIIGSNDQVRRVRVQFANRKMKWRGASTLALMDIQHPKDRITGIISKITEEGEKKYRMTMKAAIKVVSPEQCPSKTRGTVENCSSFENN